MGFFLIVYADHGSHQGSSQGNSIMVASDWGKNIVFFYDLVDGDKGLGLEKELKN